MLRDSTVVAVVRTRPRAIPLAMKTMRKSIHGFPLVSYMVMGLRMAVLRAAGAPLKLKSHQSQVVISSSGVRGFQLNNMLRSKTSAF